MEYFIILLILLMFTFALLLFLFLSRFKELNLLVSMMPNKKIIKKVIKQHKLVSNHFPFSGSYLTDKLTVVLLTSSTCVYNQAFEEIGDIVKKYNSSFLHLTHSNTDKKEIKRGSIENSSDYYEVSVPKSELILYDLIEFPQYLILKDKKVLEVTGTPIRVDYLLANELINNA